MENERKVVIITGAAQGIGRAVAQEYVNKGYQVVIADVKEATDLQDVLCIQTDVRNPADIDNLIKQTVHTYDRIDILINNAGKMLWKSPYDVTVDEWDDVLNTNLRSMFLLSREAAKHMRKNENGGSIVNIASTRALMSEPNTELYAASKGGIVSLTHALAASFADDRITVNAISPGWIETSDYSLLTEADHAQHFSKRVGKPADIARACLFLTDDNNDFITGTNMVIDGGMTKKMIYVE
ncbi:MAG: SDR family oxidoreductase [Bacillus sp. (in: firmicutes)]